MRIEDVDLENPNENELTVYKKIARDALMSWNGLSEEEATKKVQESSNEELESQVYAEGSIDAAIKGFQEYSQEYFKHKHGIGEPITEYDVELFKELIMTGKYRNGSNFDFAQIIRKKIGLYRDDFNGEQMVKDTTKMVISVLSTIHDTWVRDNQKKFFARDKKYQHMPIELIGWKEAKSDLLFLSPILDEMRLSDWASEEDLEKAYNQRVQEFLEEKGITNIEELKEQISKGADFYPALEGQDDIIEALKDTELVEEQVISGIKDKGIGTNEQFAQQLFVEKDDIDRQIEEKQQEVYEAQKRVNFYDDPILDIENAESGNAPKNGAYERLKMAKKELEELRAKKQELVEEKRKLIEEEKLIEEKENQGQNIE